MKTINEEKLAELIEKLKKGRFINLQCLNYESQPQILESFYRNSADFVPSIIVDFHKNKIPKIIFPYLGSETVEKGNGSRGEAYTTTEHYHGDPKIEYTPAITQATFYLIPRFGKKGKGSSKYSFLNQSQELLNKSILEGLILEAEIPEGLPQFDFFHCRGSLKIKKLIKIKDFLLRRK